VGCVAEQANEMKSGYAECDYVNYDGHCTCLCRSRRAHEMGALLRQGPFGPLFVIVARRRRLLLFTTLSRDSPSVNSRKVEQRRPAHDVPQDAHELRLGVDSSQKSSRDAIIGEVTFPRE